MLITVFGATGKVGRRIVQMALALGHEVRAFGRNVDALIDQDLRQDNFHAIKGYVFDDAEVFDAIKGADAVCSALGGAINGTDKTRSLGMKHIITQMQKAGVKRIVSVAGMGLLNDDEHVLIMNRPTYPPVFLPVSSEHKLAWDYLQQSGLGWTIICPPDIADADATGHYLTATGYPPTPFKNRINAGDIAHCMLQSITSGSNVHERLGICEAP